MNSAWRLAKLLTKIKASKSPVAHEAFEEVFEVNSCVGIMNKLRICDTQISALKEKSHVSLINYLNTIFNCKTLHRNFQAEKNAIDSYIMALETAGAYMEHENIDTKNITDLSELLQQMRDSIEKADTPEHYKDVLNNYVDEMLEGIVDIDIGGIEAFTSHVEIANGKVVLYNQAFTESGLMDITTKIYNVSTKILSDAQTWSGVIGFASGKLLGN